MKWIVTIVLFLFLPFNAAFAQYKVKQKSGDVLAHSLSFDPDFSNPQLPEALQEMLRTYRVGKRHANRYRGKAVEPLLRSKRHQEAPFNGSAPYYIYKDGTVSSQRCVTGCVATALEQVVSYWRHPAELKDTLHGWETDNYVISDVMPGTRIDWDNILVNYEEGQYTEAQAKAIADLTYYLGVAVHMNWGPGSSGASLYRAFNTLYDAFDYKTVAFVQRALYSNEAWNRMLRHELECGRPITFAGHNYSLAGHCFNIDGVDEDGYYHCVWGEYDIDGYFDLDFLSPFEQPDDPTPLGQQMGYFNNQTALFMHPDDFEIDIWDTLSIDDAFYRVVVDTVTFSREPDLQGYVRADFSLTNTSSQSLNYTFEVMTYLPSDTAIFEQADYVGLTAVNLAPGEHKVWPVYCHFTEAGERLFTYSADDETTPYTIPITIQQGTAPVYRFGDATYQLLRFRRPDGTDDLTARLTFDISNDATSGAAANVNTYCLFEEGEAYDTRHFGIPQIFAGTTYTETVDFHNLKDGQTYTYRTRYPWAFVNELTFTVDAREATDGIDAPQTATDQALGQGGQTLYDLYGRRIVTPYKGISICNGRKVLHP